MSVVKLYSKSTVFLLCDMQTRFRQAIHGFDHVVATSNKMLKLAKILDIPVIVTEQNPRGRYLLSVAHAEMRLGLEADHGATHITALGPTVPELDLSPLGPLHLGTFEKTLFSMAIPPVKTLLEGRQARSVVLFGIESHVCVLQSALDLLENGYNVHVLADGVSSCNAEEVPYALARMRQGGAQITTSESLAFQLQRDSSLPNFKTFSQAIKDERDPTRQALEGLLKSHTVL